MCVRDPNPLPCTPHSCPRLVASLAPTAFTRSRSLSKLIASLVKTGKETLKINNIGTQRGDPEEDNNGVSIGTSAINSKPPATAANEKLAGVPPVTSRPGSPASPVLRSYPVGRGIFLPFGRLLSVTGAIAVATL